MEGYRFPFFHAWGLGLQASLPGASRLTQRVKWEAKVSQVRFVSWMIQATSSSVRE